MKNPTNEGYRTDYLNPSLRTTSSNLSSVINGLATILMFLFIDLYLSILTDEVAEGKYREPAFRNQVVILIVARLPGTLLAQLLFFTRFAIHCICCRENVKLLSVAPVVAGLSPVAAGMVKYHHALKR